MRHISGSGGHKTGHTHVEGVKVCVSGERKRGEGVGEWGEEEGGSV